MWTLVDLTDTNDPDTGDIYSGLDRFGRAKDNRWYNFDSEEDIDRIQYGYDRVGNRIWRHNPVAAGLSEEFDEIYYYDGVHRLKEMQRGTLNGSQTELTSKTFAQCWTLDSTGNWTGFREDDNGDNTWDLVQERTANGVNEITGLTNTTGPTWSTPAYNRAGNMTTIPTPQTPGLDWNTLSTEEWSDLTTDEWAGLDASLTRSATYDAWNRLVKITDNDVVLSDYTYDGAKRRIVQRSYTEGVLTETRHYFYTQPTQWQVLEERLGTSPDAADAERQFAWGLRYIDDLIVRDRDTNADGTLDERLYACQDGNWNVTAIVDDNGAVQERYAYSAYGVPVFLTGGWVVLEISTVENGYLFTGREIDLRTNLIDFRRRWLAAASATFTTRDPVGYAAGTSLSAAFGLMPMTNVDPYGTDPFPYPPELIPDMPRPPGTIITFYDGQDKLNLEHYANELTEGRGFAIDIQLGFPSHLPPLTDCVSDLWIIDHGILGGRYGSGQSAGPTIVELTDSTLAPYCNNLCSGATIHLGGCVSCRERALPDALLNACSRIGKVRGCKDYVYWSPGERPNCAGGWSEFTRTRPPTSGQSYPR